MPISDQHDVTAAQRSMHGGPACAATLALKWFALLHIFPQKHSSFPHLLAAWSYCERLCVT